MNEQSVAAGKSSTPLRSRHRPPVMKAILQNSEIPRFVASISFAPMLTSTVSTQPSRVKNKNLVRTSRHFTAMPTRSGVGWCVQSRRAPRTPRPRLCAHGIVRDAGVLDAAHDVAVWPLASARAAANRFGCDCRSWGRRPGRSASPSGIHPRRNPSSRTFPQFTPPVRGSAGVPDLLDTKRESTSGPAVQSCGLPIVGPLLASALCPPRVHAHLRFSFLKEVHLSSASFLAGSEAAELCCNCVTWANSTGNVISDAGGGPKFPGIEPGNLLRWVWGSSYVCRVTGKSETRKHSTARVSTFKPGNHDWGRYVRD